MDIQSVHDALAAALEAASGAGSTGPLDAGFRFPDPTTGARLDFEILSIEGLGVDELHITYDSGIQPEGDTYAGPGAPLGSVLYVVRGPRRFVVQAKIECEYQTVTTAHHYAERCRTRLALPSVRDILRGAGLALQSPVGATQRVSYTDASGRVVSAVLFEFVLNSADEVQDAPVTTVEVVNFGVN